MATCGTFVGFATRMRMNQPHSNIFQINRRVSHENVSEVKKVSNLTEAKITSAAHDVTLRSLFSRLSGPQAAPFNIISLHPQLPPCLLGRLNSQQRQPLHLTVSVS